MKRSPIVIFIALILLACSTQLLPAGELSFAPDFTLSDTQGNKISLSSYRGNSRVLLFFWTTWCPFCRDELNALSKKYTDFTVNGWKIIAVDIGEPAAKIEAFIKNNPLPFPVLLDSDSMVAYLYGIIGVPTFILIDKEGRMIFRDNYPPPQGVIGKKATNG